MSGFTKLFASILESTVWGLPCETRLVWITMLAMADQDGEVSASVPGLAHRAQVSIEACEAALASFSAPDPYSRTKEHDGRRIEAIDGGWRLLNYRKYREKASLESARARNAARQERWRLRNAKALLSVTRNAPSRSVTECNAIAEAEAEAEANPPKKGDLRAHARDTPDPGVRDGSESPRWARGATAERALEVFAEAITSVTGVPFAVSRAPFLRDDVCMVLNKHGPQGDLAGALAWLGDVTSAWVQADPDCSGRAPGKLMHWLNEGRPDRNKRRSGRGERQPIGDLNADWLKTGSDL